MNIYEKLIEMLEKELKQFTMKNEISANSLEMIDMITHAIKSSETILAMRGYGDEYSKDANPYYEQRTNYTGGMSHARGRRRDGMGRYSGTASSADMMRELEELKAKAPENMKYRFQNMIDELRMY